MDELLSVVRAADGSVFVEVIVWILVGAWGLGLFMCGYGMAKMDSAVNVLAETLKKIADSEGNE
jgi:hypothetical protein